MPTPTVFSTYRQGENRVTSTFLAVLQRLSLDKIDRIIGALLGETAFQSFVFTNQPKRANGVPDGEIAASFSLALETKTARGALQKSRDELERRVLDLKLDERLVLLSPDQNEPEVVASLNCPRVIWSSFVSLSTAIDEILTDPDEPPTELESFLLRQFILFLRSDGLLEDPRDVVLVLAARVALPEYHQYSAYLCQPNRTFRQAEHIAFYASGAIHRSIPRIAGVIEEVTLSKAGIEALVGDDRKLKARLSALLDEIELLSPHRLGESDKVILLDPDIELKEDIRNDRQSAFTQGHRYVSLKAIRAEPRTTTELLKLG